MAEAALKAAAEETQDLTDGFSLVIDAMKLNGIDTIYGVPGIPITDLGRLAPRRTAVRATARFGDETGHESGPRGGGIVALSTRSARGSVHAATMPR